MAPAASATFVFGRLTVVCYAGTGQRGCGYGNTDTPAGTWSLRSRRFVNPTPAGSYLPLPTVLRVNARTHLPLRMTSGPARQQAQVDWYFLRPTPASLAQLRVPVPPGYPRSG